MTALRAASTLDDELERLMLDVWFVDIFVLAVFSAVSRLVEDCDRLFELKLMSVNTESTLDEELDKLKLEV